MATPDENGLYRLSLIKGSTTQHDNFAGKMGEVTVDETKNTLILHGSDADGMTAGQGQYEIARADLANVKVNIADTLVAQTSNNALTEIADDDELIVFDKSSSFTAKRIKRSDLIVGGSAGSSSSDPILGITTDSAGGLSSSKSLDVVTIKMKDGTAANQMMLWVNSGANRGWGPGTLNPAHLGSGASQNKILQASSGSAMSWVDAPSSLPANAAGFLKNNGSGTLSYSTLTSTDLPSGVITAASNVGGVNSGTRLLTIPKISVDQYGRVTSLSTETFTASDTDTNTTYTAGNNITITGVSNTIETVQNIRTTDSPTFVGLTLTGNLDVQGRIAVSNSVRLEVGDQYIQLNSDLANTEAPTATNATAEIVVNRGNQNRSVLRWNETGTESTGRWQLGFKSNADTPSDVGTFYDILTSNSNIDAGKVTTGTLDRERLASSQQLPSSQSTGFLKSDGSSASWSALAAGDIPDLSANQITSDTIGRDRIPESNRLPLTIADGFLKGNDNDNTMAWSALAVSDLPVVSIEKGGTGQTTASAALTALGGIASDDVEGFAKGTPGNAAMIIPRGTTEQRPGHVTENKTSTTTAESSLGSTASTGTLSVTDIAISGKTGTNALKVYVVDSLDDSLSNSNLELTISGGWDELTGLTTTSTSTSVKSSANLDVLPNTANQNFYIGHDGTNILTAIFQGTAGDSKHMVIIEEVPGENASTPPSTAMFRFNTTIGGFEGYNGSDWVRIDMPDELGDMM